MSTERTADARTLRLGFLGAGRVASALALGLTAAGYTVERIASQGGTSAGELARRLPDGRPASPAEVAEACDLVFVAVPDDQIGQLAGRVPWRRDTMVVHCSGALGTEVLASAQDAGALVGSLHPLQTLADRENGWRNLAGSTFTIEADEPLSSILEGMALALHGYPVRLPVGSKPLYHASAVLVSNAVVALVDTAAGLWAEFGESRDDAVRALLPLLAGTVANLDRLGTRGALTGPIARGDAGTVEGHLRALHAAAPHNVALYRELGLATVRLARANGQITDEQADHLRDLLTTFAPPSTNGHQTPDSATRPHTNPVYREERACV